VDIAGTLGVAELLMSGRDRERYRSDVKPYLAALDILVASLDQEGDAASAQAMLFVD
jgi:hypothetical protein